jgi:hypothetical protein
MLAWSLCIQCMINLMLTSRHKLNIKSEIHSKVKLETTPLDFGISVFFVSILIQFMTSVLTNQLYSMLTVMFKMHWIHVSLLLSCINVNKIREKTDWIGSFGIGLNSFVEISMLYYTDVQWFILCRQIVNLYCVYLYWSVYTEEYHILKNAATESNPVHCESIECKQVYPKLIHVRPFRTYSS